MKYSCIISVDPGASGAAVVRTGEGIITHVETFRGFGSIRTAVSKATSSPAGARGVAAVIERVWGSPVMGVASSFTFGDNYGNWCGALRMAGIDVYAVTPQVWQKVAAPNLGVQGNARKAALKERAEAMFDLPIAAALMPKGLRITLKNCDALLLSNYSHWKNQRGEELGERLPEEG